MSRSFLVPILLPADPTIALQAATKQYVDATAGGTGNVLSFGFNASTSEPPTGNQVRLNNATQTAATLVWISQTTWDGMDVTIGLSRVLAGYQLYMQDFNDSTHWLLFNVTGAGTDKGSYWEFPITYNSGPGALPGAKMALQSISPANHGIPSGGADGDVLTKTSSSDYAAAWETPTGGGGVQGLIDTTDDWNDYKTPGTWQTQVPVDPAAQHAPPTLSSSHGTMVVSRGADDTTHVDNMAGSYQHLSQSFIFEQGAWTRAWVASTDPEDLWEQWTPWRFTGDPGWHGLTNDNLPFQPALTLKGNNTVDESAVMDLTVAEVQAMLGTGGGGAPVGTKLSALTALTGAGAATTDIVEVVDVSDTTMAASGTNKKMTWAEVIAFLGGQGQNGLVPGNRQLAGAAGIVISPGTWLGEEDQAIELATFTADIGGGVPAPLTVTGKYLKDDATWDTPAAGTPADGSVTNAKLANMVQSTIKGRTAGAGTGDPVDLTAAQAKTILAIANTDVSGLGSLATKSTVATADITDDNVTNVKLANMPTLTLKGNSTGSTADPADLTVAQVKTMLGIDNITVSGTAPSSPNVGDLWVDTS